jgi:hypothetical protein
MTEAEHSLFDPNNQELTMVSRLVKLSFVLLCLILQLGCQEKVTPNDILALENKIKDLETQNQATWQLAMRAKYNLDEIILRPSEKGFGAVRTNLGILVISFENIEPYADGSKVKLNIGNLQVGTFSDIKATIEWGTLGKDGFLDVIAQKTKDLTLSGEFISGRWNPYELTLEEIPPDKFSFIRLKDLSISSVSLSKPQ